MLSTFLLKREKENIKHEDQEGIFNDKQQYFVQKIERKGKTETKNVKIATCKENVHVMYFYLSSVLRRMCLCFIVFFIHVCRICLSCDQRAGVLGVRSCVQV